MEKEIKKQTDTKVKNFMIIVLIIFIFLTTLIMILSYLLFSPTEEIISNQDTLQENIIQETDSPIISEIPLEKDEDNDISDATEENPTQEVDNNSQTENTTSLPSVPENATNTSTNNNSSNSSNSTNNTQVNDSVSSDVAPSAPVVKPYIIRAETSTELTKSETKYGVIINTYTTSTYDLYSDGSKQVKSSYTSLEYDRTNYNATTSELLSEAKTTKNQYSAMINQVFKNVNSYRKDANTQSVDGIANRKNLSLNENLCIAACARAVEMAYSSKFSHTRPNGSKFYSILDEMNISYMTAGENIAYGYSSAESASKGWKNSEGHYKNMISPDFSQIGIGVFEIEGNFYWVQIFN